MDLAAYSDSNIAEIKELFTSVFSDSEGKSEGLVIGSLVYDLMINTDAKDFHCFTVTEHGRIVGSVMFSRITFDKEGSAFILSPIAVDTNYQRKGIGKKLINFGIEFLRENKVELLFTYGDPKYYSKFGFEIISEDLIKAPLTLTYPEGWLCQSLLGNEITAVMGGSYCVAALNRPELW